MTLPGTDMVRRGSIEELCGHRNRALELYRHAFETLGEANRAYQAACGGTTVYEFDFLRDVQMYRDDADRVVAGARSAVDRSMWRYVIKATNLGSLMDAEERAKFEKSLEKDVPECSPDNVFATVENLTRQANLIFRRGLVKAFMVLSKEHASNSGFAIGAKAIFRGGVTWAGSFGFRLNTYREDQIKDIDRCMHVLDGRPSPDYQQGLCAAMRTAMQAGEARCETDLIEARWHKTGTVHLLFKRDDLRTRANLLIAEHFGATLGASRDARRAASHG